MSTAPERRRILVTGATGKQGGAVLRALLDSQSESDLHAFEILALTRNSTSKTAQTLSSRENVKIVLGDLNHVSEIFEQAGGIGSIWGVFSVQVPDNKADPYSDENKEFRQGADLVDASIKYGVSHFVQTSVDRGGDDSDNNPTPIPHFITKHRIEQHLKARTQDSNLTYTILRPVAFMDMMTPNMFGRIFGALIGRLEDKPLQLVATRDIGIIAAQAFTVPDTDEYKNASISLAGDELTQQECNETFWKVLHRPMPKAYDAVAGLLMWMVPEVGTMFQWFKNTGYKADISKCRKLNSNMLDLAAFLKQESGFSRQNKPHPT